MARCAAERGWQWLEQIRIAQRSGEAVFIVYRFLQVEPVDSAMNLSAQCGVMYNDRLIVCLKAQ